MKPTIKITTQEARQHGIDLGRDTVGVENLNLYGFDTELINSMVKFEIFPQTYLHMGRVLVLRREICEVVNKLLHGSMKLYETVEEADRLKEEAAKLAESNTVELTEDDQARITAGEITYTDLLLEKVAAKNGVTVDEVRKQATGDDNEQVVV